MGVPSAKVIALRGRGAPKMRAWHAFATQSDAEKTGISGRFLKNWVSRRRVPFIKVGRLVLFDPMKG
jgi:hypothetical protein